MWLRMLTCAMRSYKRLRKVVLGIHSVSLKLPVEYRVQGSSKVKYDKLTGDMNARRVYLIHLFDMPHLLLMEMDVNICV